MDKMQSTRNKLIKLLEQSESEYVSGQVLSDYLNISRSAIWKHMKELEKDGYTIEGKPRKGYRIIASPHKVSENTLRWGLHTEWLGKTIIHRKKTASTQKIAHQVAQDGAKHGTVIIADEQTEGRGRMNRPWHSTKEQGIWLSILLRPNMLPVLTPQLTLLTATVLADVIDELTDVTPQIKWPNDILIHGKKMAGILTELQAEQDQIQYLIIGIGMNINQRKADLPEQLQHKATSLRIETGQKWDLTPFTQRLLMEFEKTYTSYMKNGFSEVRNKWESYGLKIGQPISIQTMNDQWKAIFSGIADDGALLIKNLDGSMEKFYSAEIDWFDEGAENNE